MEEELNVLACACINPAYRTVPLLCCIVSHIAASSCLKLKFEISRVVSCLSWHCQFPHHTCVVSYSHITLLGWDCKQTRIASTVIRRPLQNQQERADCVNANTVTQNGNTQRKPSNSNTSHHGFPDTIAILKHNGRPPAMSFQQATLPQNSRSERSLLFDGADVGAAGGLNGGVSAARSAQTTSSAHGHHGARHYGSYGAAPSSHDQDAALRSEAETERTLAAQDATLAQLSQGVSTVRSIAVDIHKEVDEQLGLLDDMGQSMGQTSTQLDVETQRVRESRDTVYTLQNFCLLLWPLVLLIILLVEAVIHFIFRL